jgi:D-3-phosphoglycerate dehydrogenase
MAMKVMIADAFPERRITELRHLGCEVVVDPTLKEDSLEAALEESNPDILIVRSTRVTGDMMTRCSGLSLIIRAGSGYNTIDVKTASERSVYVANCPGKNAVAVAELTLGLMLSLDRRIPDNVADLRAGVWNKKEYSKADGLFGKTMGIIGTGRIGLEVISRVRAFGMGVAAWSRSLTRERATVLGVEYCATPLAVASRADVISVHLALAPETEKLIGREFFDAMKPGAYFINTSRAEVVDHGELARAMSEKSIRAALDVFDGEPSGKEGSFDDAIVKTPGLYGTHHIGASTGQAQNAVADETVSIVRDYMDTGHVRNCVNLLERVPARFSLSVHHRNRVGVLAGVLDIIRDADINIETMENIIFRGGEGACARILIDGKLGKDRLRTVEGSSDDIFSVTQVALDRG